MKIGIDATWAIIDQSGIGKYTYNLIKALLAEDSNIQYVLFFDYWRDRAKRHGAIKELVKGAKAPYEIKTKTILTSVKELLIQLPATAKYFYDTPVDVMHFPFFSGVPVRFPGKAVATIHDLVYLRYPEHRGKRLSNYYLKKTKTALKISKKIIAVSEATKADLIKYLGVAPERIKTIPEGVTANFRPILNRRALNAYLKKYRLESQQYILSVGTLEPRKNLTRLVKAYSLLANSLRSQYKLVIIGPNGWNSVELFKTINDLNLKSQIILPGYIDHEELPYFYNGAKVFVYPALYEGFGLPPLEAMACGTPVIVSNISSLPEVVGRAGVLINPLKEEEIATAIKKVLTNDKISGSLAAKGLVQAKKFSWARTAQETIKLYREIYKSKA